MVNKVKSYQNTSIIDEVRIFFINLMKLNKCIIKHKGKCRQIKKHKKRLIHNYARATSQQQNARPIFEYSTAIVRVLMIY